LIDDNESEMESEFEGNNGNIAAVLEPTADNITSFGMGINRETVISRTAATRKKLYQKLLKGGKTHTKGLFQDQTMGSPPG
jgi:hypothetical protein